MIFKNKIVIKKYIQLLVMIFICQFSKAQITTVNLSPVADATIYQLASTTNYGNATLLESFPFGDSTKRFVMKFDLTSIPSNAQITEARLFLFNAGTRGFDRTINVHRLTQNWEENTVTWSSISNQFSSTISASYLFQWFPQNIDGIFNLTNDVQNMVINSQNNFGWIFKDQSEDVSQSYWFFHSKDILTQSLKPYLQIRYEIPELVQIDIISNTGSFELCSGNSIVLTASGASNYSWFANNNPIGQGNSITVSPNSNTIYKATATVDGTTIFKEITVIVKPSPNLVVYPSLNNNIILGNSITLLVSGGNSYLWSPSNLFQNTTSQIQTITPTNSTNASIIATNLNGCSITKNIQLNVIDNSASTKQYHNLVKKLDNTYINVNNELNISYLEEYDVDNFNQLNYKIYNTTRDIILSSSNYAITIQKGLNLISIPNLSSFCTVNNYYILEIENIKNDKYYLRFKYN